ncbi:MAG: esterase, partial [Muribaculaceae bacterium]|nr:esterase [Muribaculaceae bacterium]
MKRNVLVAFAAFCFSMPGVAQNEAIVEDFVPSEMNQHGQQYPMVNSQGYARFEVNAPEAQSV